MCSLCTFTDTCVNTARSAQVLDGACIMYTEYTLHMCQLYQIKCLIHSFKSTKILGSYKKALKLKVEYVCPCVYSNCLFFSRYKMHL
jgi:hypothetical protein